MLRRVIYFLFGLPNKNTLADIPLNFRNINENIHKEDNYRKHVKFLKENYLPAWEKEIQGLNNREKQDDSVYLSQLLKELIAALEKAAQLIEVINNSPLLVTELKETDRPYLMGLEKLSLINAGFYDLRLFNKKSKKLKLNELKDYFFTNPFDFSKIPEGYCGMNSPVLVIRKLIVDLVLLFDKFAFAQHRKHEYVLSLMQRFIHLSRWAVGLESPYSIDLAINALLGFNKMFLPLPSILSSYERMHIMYEHDTTPETLPFIQRILIQSSPLIMGKKIDENYYKKLMNNDLHPRYLRHNREYF